MRPLLFNLWFVAFLSAAAVAQATLADNTGPESSTVRLSPSSVNFGTQPVGKGGVMQGVLINLTNTGNSAVTIFAIRITGADSGDFFEENLCPSTLPAGGVCTITVGVNPTAIGPRIAALSVSDNAPPSPQTVSLKGTGTDAQLSTVSLRFGNQPVGTTSNPMTVTLTNVGSTSMSISRISVAGLNAADFAETNTCGTSLEAG